MSEMFPEASPSPFGPDEPPSAMVEEARRAHALELAVRLHAASLRSGSAGIHGGVFVTNEVITTAGRFTDYLRGGA